MNLAVIGSGGREHAICYKLKQSPKIKKLICIPGNAGTQKIAENIKEDISNFDALYRIIKNKNIDIVIIGPEQPLVDGLVDFLNKKNRLIKILISYLILHIFVVPLLANNRLPVVQHSNKLIG